MLIKETLFEAINSLDIDKVRALVSELSGKDLVPALRYSLKIVGRHSLSSDDQIGYALKIFEHIGNSIDFPLDSSFESKEYIIIYNELAAELIKNYQLYQLKRYKNQIIFNIIIENISDSNNTLETLGKKYTPVKGNHSLLTVVSNIVTLLPILPRQNFNQNPFIKLDIASM